MQNSKKGDGDMEGGEAHEEEKLPPGFRFHPTDEELLTYYLTHKIAKANFTARAIAEVDLNKCEPWDLPGKAKMGEKEWYFFSLRDRKYPTGMRTNRATNAGYWKTTGKDKEICDSRRSCELAGMKKTLVFYKGRAPRGEKTNWVMHEYRLQPNSTKGNLLLADEWVVCRVILKSNSGSKKSSSGTQSHRLLNPCGLNMTVPPILPTLFGARTHSHNLAELLLRYPIGRSPTSLNLIPAIHTQQLDQQQLFRAVNAPMNTAEALLLPQLSSTPFAGCGGIAGCESGYGGGSNLVGAARFQNLEDQPCMDLEGYWPAYN